MGISFSSLDSKGRDNDHSSKSDGRMGRKDGNHHADTIGPSCFSEVTQFRASRCDGWHQILK